jgi:hypothetical protein
MRRPPLTPPRRAGAAAVAAALGALLGACDSAPAAGPADAGIDAATTPDAACFESPTTHREIINACTDAQKVFKDPVMPLLGADRTLPALPP